MTRKSTLEKEKSLEIFKKAFYQRTSLLISQNNKKEKYAWKVLQSVQNISYFYKDTVFTVRKKKVIDGITYYWVKNTKNDKNITKRFVRSELFALKANF